MTDLERAEYLLEHTCCPSHEEAEAVLNELSRLRAIEKAATGWIDAKDEDCIDEPVWFEKVMDAEAAVRDALPARAAAGSERSVDHTGGKAVTDD